MLLRRFIMCITVIGFAHEAAAGDIETAYLRGSQGYEASGRTYRVPQVAAPWYPTSAPAPSYVANPIEGEDPESYDVRAALEASGDVKGALHDYPRNYTFEKAMLNHLAAHPNDDIGALRALPLSLLIMFVHAYQSFLYNRILSERMRRGLPIREPIEGDLVLPANRQGLLDRERTIEVVADNLERVAARCRAGKAWVSAVLYGSESTFAAGEMGEIERETIEAEGVRPEDFIIPDLPRISSRGTRREILAPIRQLRTALEEGVLRIDTELTRGAYATCLVREYSKDG